MNIARARLLAKRVHRGQRQPTGEPLIAHVSRVAAATPESARPVAWLHEIFEWTSVSEEKLLAYGASDDELRALRNDRPGPWVGAPNWAPWPTSR